MLIYLPMFLVQFSAGEGIRMNIVIFKIYALFEPGNRRILLLKFSDFHPELILCVFRFHICALSIIVLPEGQQKVEKLDLQKCL